MMSNDERIGEIVHYYHKISVAVIKLKNPLQVGEKIHLVGAHTDFMQEVRSMQIEHEVVEEAQTGDEVAVKVDQRVRRGDTAFRLAE
jgi:translation elongation factor EF-1alpha